MQIPTEFSLSQNYPDPFVAQVKVGGMEHWEQNGSYCGRAMVRQRLSSLKGVKTWCFLGTLCRSLP